MPKELYKILCEAREHLGKAHDKIAYAIMSWSGNHHKHISAATCDEINALIEKMHDACGEE